MSRLANTIEAILYLKAQPLKIAQIAELAKCDRDTAEEGLIELMGEYAHRDGAIEIAETEDGYALQLREIYKPLVDDIVPLDIGLGALRTLAAIALRGPIAQSELVDLRGSGVYQHVPDLVDQGFVKKRRQSDGRSSWLQITEKFYQHFEIDKLPQITNLRLPKPIDKAANANVGTSEAQASEAQENETRSSEDISLGEPTATAEISLETDTELSDTELSKKSSKNEMLAEESADSKRLGKEATKKSSETTENSGRLADQALDAISQDRSRDAIESGFVEERPSNPYSTEAENGSLEP